ncbi:MAG: SPFH domain-containing protein, partial [Anaerolineales bacterium]
MEKKGPKSTRQSSYRIPAIAIVIALAVYGIGALFAYLMIRIMQLSEDVGGAIFAIFILLGTFLLYGIKIANQWEKAIVLRLGRFNRLRGPGLFWVTPVVESIANWIDHRVMVTPFSAEKTLTKDTVPLDEEAVLYR